MSADVPGGLYAATRGRITLERTRAFLEPWSRLSTKTYFGRVELSYLQRWTRVSELEVVLTARGRGQIHVVADDHLPGRRTVASRSIESDEQISICLPVQVDRYLEAGHLWLEAETDADSLEIADVHVGVVDAEREHRGIAVVICTFNRPRDCCATLTAIMSDTEVAGRLDRIVIVDQGTDLVADRPEFAAIRDAFADRLVVIRQGNHGGAGGFTRGLLEIQDLRATGASTILMDDDIRLEPESLSRLISFDAYRRRPTIVGGQMLKLHHPSILLTHGEQTDLAELSAGIPVDPEAHGIDLLHHLPQRRVDVEYNAWWLCLIPADIIEAVGLPLPVFYQGDDFEFGLRARRAGFLTVTLPGAAVWHADFEFKDWDGPIAFFSVRNALIAAALHSPLSPQDIAQRLGVRLWHQILEFRYGLTATLVAAVEQFLDGPAILQRPGTDALAELDALRTACVDMQSVTVDQLREQGLDHLRIQHQTWEPDDGEKGSLRRLVGQFRGRLLDDIALPSGRPWWYGSSHRTIVAIDRAQQGYRVRRFDRQQARVSLRERRRIVRRLRTEGEAAAEAWREALPRLSSQDSWHQLLGIDAEARSAAP